MLSTMFLLVLATTTRNIQRWHKSQLLHVSLNCIKCTHIGKEKNTHAIFVNKCECCAASFDAVRRSHSHTIDMLTFDNVNTGSKKQYTY